MANFVMVHGGGHGGWCWQRLAKLLRKAGHEVYTPTLTGLGERSHLLRPDTNLETHINDVVGVLKYEGVTNAILVGHSYGGMVITGAADRALTQVGQLVYLDGAHPRDGESLVDLATAAMNKVRKGARVVAGVEVVLWPDSTQTFGVTNPDDVAWMQEKLTPHPWKSFEQPLRLANEIDVLHIPRTNINCPATTRTQEPKLMLRSLTADRVWEIDTGHDLMITEPQAVAEMLLRLVSL